MGTSIYSLTSNAFIEMRNDECRRREMRNRFMVLIGALALLSVALTQMIYTVSGLLSIPAFAGIMLCTVSCLCLALPEGTVGAGLVSKVTAVAGAAAMVLAVV